MAEKDTIELNGVEFALKDATARSSIVSGLAGVKALLAPVEASSTASQAYEMGELFVYNGTLYEAVAKIAKNGTITPNTNCIESTLEHRIQYVVDELIGVHLAQLADAGKITGIEQMIAPRETTSTAAAAHPEGSLFIKGNKLYVATEDIDEGDTITPDTNCEKTTLAAWIAQLIAGTNEEAEEEET